ncbi:MAG: LapA family protein [Moraxella sp.]|nr:LapA family protein [Moraxella sp.]
MSLFLMILLLVFFGYSLALVLANNSEVAVNLLFSQVPTTNLGLVLILTTTLGVLIGILLALLLFKVLQNKLELHKLRKEVANLESQLLESKVALEKERQSHVVLDTDTTDQAQPQTQGE